MIRHPRACRGRTAMRFPAKGSHVCCVELTLKGLASAGKGLFYTGFPKARGAEFYTRLGLHSRHCGEFCCDFRGVCVSLWTPAPVCSWFPVLPLTW